MGCGWMITNKKQQILQPTLKIPNISIIQKIDAKTQTQVQVSMVHMNNSTYQTKKPIENEIKKQEKQEKQVKQEHVQNRQQMLSSIVVKVQYQPYKRQNTMTTKQAQKYGQPNMILRNRKFSQKNNENIQEKSPLSQLIKKKKKQKKQNQNQNQNHIQAPFSQPIKKQKSSSVQKKIEKQSNKINKIIQSYFQAEQISFPISEKTMTSEKKDENPQKQSDLSAMLKKRKLQKKQSKYQKQQQKQNNTNFHRQYMTNQYYSQANSNNGNILNALAQHIAK